MEKQCEEKARVKIKWRRHRQCEQEKGVDKGHPAKQMISKVCGCKLKTETETEKESDLANTVNSAGERR